jgi:integrase
MRCAMAPRRPVKCRFMGQKALAAGELGNVWYTTHPENSEDRRVQARARARLWDRTDTTRPQPGQTVNVKGYGRDTTGALNALNAHIRKRQDQADQEAAGRRKQAEQDARDLAVQHHLGALAVIAIEEAASEGDIGQNTADAYRSQLRRITESDFGRTPIEDIDINAIRTFLAQVAHSIGFGAAATTRAVISRTYDYAIGKGIVKVNASREGGKLPKRPAFDPNAEIVGLDPTRSLSPWERLDLSRKLRADDRACRLDLRDLVMAGMAIGGRLGEVMAIRWTDVTITRTVVRGGKKNKIKAVKLTATVRINATVTRVHGGGSQRTPTKTQASHRTIPVPQRTAALLARRARAAGLSPFNTAGDLRPVFPSCGFTLDSRATPMAERTKLRDRANTTHHLRAVFDTAGYDWLSFHTLRRTVATTLADNHIPIHKIKQRLGHSSVRTTEAYIKDTEDDGSALGFL